MMKDRFYFDHAATAPLSGEALAAMTHWWNTPCNSGARHHSFGSRASFAVEEARNQIASLINCRSEEIVFTSGATEANNFAVKGLAKYLKSQGKTHIITSVVEHKSILEPLKKLKGFQVTFLPVKSCAMLEASAVEKALTPETGLVTVQAVNNETGTIQPIKEISMMLEGRGIIFHVDAAQALGKIEFDVTKLKIDMASFSAHKAGGPQGIGALYFDWKLKNKVSPILYGGGQENGLRAGTLPTALCVGFGAACAAIKDNRAELQVMREAFLDKLKPLRPVIYGHSDPDWNAPGILNLRFPGIDSETLVMALPELAFGVGSACSSHGEEYSHVINAIADTQAAREAVRLSFGSLTSMGDLQEAAELIYAAVENIRQFKEAV